MKLSCPRWPENLMLLYPIFGAAWLCNAAFVLCNGRDLSQAIHAFSVNANQDVDARDKPGHDGLRVGRQALNPTAPTRSNP